MRTSIPSKESIIEHIKVMLTDRAEQKQQIIAEISHTKIQNFDDIIKAIENFIIKNNSAMFSFFSTSRLQKQLSILAEGLKKVKNKHEIEAIESKNYQQYLQHDKRLDEVIKTILEYSPSRRDVETLKLIGKDFEGIVEKLKTFTSEYECAHSETKPKVEKPKMTKNVKIDKLLQPIKESKDAVINSFLQLAQLRFYQFITGGLLNLKAGDIHECYFEGINDTKKKFTPIMFEFNSEREELLNYLFYTIENFKDPSFRDPDEKSNINAAFMFVKLLQEDREHSVDFDWLKEKIMLLTNTPSDAEDLIRTARSKIGLLSSCCF
jgi:hypothetical protein